MKKENTKPWVTNSKAESNRINLFDGIGEVETPANLRILMVP